MGHRFQTGHAVTTFGVFVFDSFDLYDILTFSGAKLRAEKHKNGSC